MQYIVRWGRDLFPLLLEEFKVIKQIGVIRRFSRLSNLLLLLPVKKKKLLLLFNISYESAT